MDSAAIQSVTHKLAVGAFFSAVLLPVVLFGQNGPWFGAGELAIRNRTEFPRKLTPMKLQALDAWFADRIGLRYPLIYLGTEFHLGAFGRPLERRIFFGREGWMFWTEDTDKIPSAMADSRGKLRFTPQETNRIEAELLSMRAHFAACRIPFAVVVAPNKQSIYREFVLNAGADEPRTRLDALLAALSPTARSIVVDTRQTIHPAKLKHAPLRLYNKTETHWNELGAFYGYLAIIDALRHDLALSQPELAFIDRYTISARRYAGGDMATHVLFSPWRFPDEDVSVRRKTIMSLPPDQIDARNLIARNVNGRGKLLLVGDSFTGGIVRYLQQHFAEVHNVISTSIDGRAVARLRPDAVLLLMVERNLEILLRPHVHLAATCAR
jgi:hypothetical protein